MKNANFMIVAVAVVFLFFIQMAGTLVESIYILNLLNTALDAKALGLLFFFSPILLILSREKASSWFIWTVFGVLLIARGITPYLDTAGRLWTSGVGTGSVLLLLPFMFTAVPKDQLPTQSGNNVSAGFALGIGLSVLLRTANYSIDYSLTPAGSWVGWGLGLLLGFGLMKLDWNRLRPPQGVKPGRVTLATFSIILILTLVYFVFSAPAVLVRWTEGHYPLIISIASLVPLGWILLALNRPSWLKRISPKLLLIWNILFTTSLLITILVHRVPFPPTPDSAAIVIGSPTWIQQIPALLTLLLYPVIFLDLQRFIAALQLASPAPGELIPGMTLGSLALILLVFMMIFTNVWGYIEPVSPVFRNMFWLPFALITGLLTLLSFRQAQNSPSPSSHGMRTSLSAWVVILAVIFLLTVAFSISTTQTFPAEEGADSLLVMTYNIQAANDQAGEKAYQRQLDLIQNLSPDIVALQESDTARISLNNNDYVRFFAGKLGYYSYYGPTTVSGTFGTAILSRFPLQNTQTIFSYSDQDEIGTAIAEIMIDGNIFTIYNVHPDGSDTPMLTFAKVLLDNAAGQGRVIALGDYNLREDEIPYQMIDAIFTNAWTSVYPSGISDSGVDMSGRKRIDHIFLSNDLWADNPVYLLPPDSHTDHPAHWTRLFWEE